MPDNKKTASKTAAYVFLGFLVLLCLFCAFIYAPLTQAVNIGERGLSHATAGGETWYRLDAEDYQVAGVLGEVDVSNSTFRALSTRYTYYCVVVRMPDGRTTTLPVCVKGQKAQILGAGATVPLYGTLSETRDSIEYALEDYGIEPGETGTLCLNDNGATVFSRWVSSCIFGIAATVAIWLIMRIRRR